MFVPRGVAIIGASAELSKIGGQPVRFLSTYGYQGRVYPVNPKYVQVGGIKCYPDVASIDGPCDLALIAVKAEDCTQALRECGKYGIRFAVIFTSGFRETGPHGEALQAELSATALECGIRFVGPNCQGILNLTNRLYATFGVLGLEPQLKVGHVSSVAQSGGFGFGVVSQAEALGVGFRFIVSSGNEADISTPELFEAFIDDPETRILAGYIEGVRDGRALMRAACRATRARKPVLMWKTGNSDAGRRASLSHTGALTGSYDIYRAAYRQAGIIEVRDIDELSDYARAFGANRLPDGGRVAALGTSAGSCISFADRCVELGLVLPDLTPDTEKALRKIIPAYGSPHNPVDVTASVFNDTGLFTRAVNLILDDPNVDQLAILLAGISGELAIVCNRAIARAARNSSKPLLLCWTARRHRAEEAYRIIEEAGVPYFTSPVRLANAAGALARFAASRRRLSKKAGVFSGSLDASRIHEAACDVAGVLNEVDSKRLVAAAGIPITTDVVVAISDDPVCAVRNLTYPMVAKVLSKDIPHKTDIGGVIVNIHTDEQLRSAFHAIVKSVRLHAPTAQIDGILIAEMVQEAQETIVGVVEDAVFGPVVTFGLGGIHAEVLRDVAYRVAPFDVETAREMVEELRAKALFNGIRGRPVSDVAALSRSLSDISQFAWEMRGRLKELDINPLLVRSAGMGVVAADALAVLGSP
jgi:acyl-CoA synthetase (NDP forming)